MTDFKFGMLDLFAEQLEKHKDKLGPFHRPLVMLLGAILFVLFFALLIGAPILWMKDFVYIAVLQACLVAAFFMLLLTIPLDVYDRFVFCMALFLVLAAAPIMVTLGLFFGLLVPEDAGAFADAVSGAKPEIFMYALLRGLAHVTWALPMLFLFFTFHPRIEARGAGQLAASLRLTFWAALIMQAVASTLHLWLGGTSKVFQSTAAANDGLADLISGNQTGFLVFQAIYVLLGFATVIAARRWYQGSDKRWLAIVVTGMLAVQGCYMLASYNNRQIILHYPASRTSAHYVLAWQNRESGDYAFTLGRPNTISQAKFASFIAYAACEVPESLKFTLKVADVAQFKQQYEERAMALVPAGQKFCQPEGSH